MTAYFTKGHPGESPAEAALRWSSERDEVNTYVIEMVGYPFIKIGKTNRPLARLDQLQTGNPCPLRLLFLIRGDVEADLHKRFERQRVRGEWFKFDKYTRGILASLERVPFQHEVDGTTDPWVRREAAR